MKLDHAVWFTERTPDTVAGQYEGTYRGGSHEKWGTYNALKYLQNGYIEWLAVEDPETAGQSGNPLVRLLLHDLAAYGEGWGTLCFSTDGIDQLDARLTTAGFKTSGVLNASRKSTAGSLKKWKLLFIEESYTDKLPFPFFIQWEEDEETRRNVLMEEGFLGETGASERIEECVLETDDPQAAIGNWCRLLDVRPDTVDSFLLGNIRFRFQEAAGPRHRLTAVTTGHTES
ncbi:MULTISPECIES: VOC family protein [Sporosarcina]|uniref:VOC family protein n=1 Tax=Sporosarcina TaxID=1569 RepID=UPI0006944335|nr:MULTISPECIES: VOC family protein [Sporosarcina]WJY27116.1 VOC family protein [Sporosarcina sp. 0.2-SM1T-5]